MALLDLPSEILTLIASHLVPSPHTSIDHLLICRQWYHAALPACLSSLSLSTTYLSSYDILRLPPPHTPLSNHITKHVERLSIRLVGHPSRQHAIRPWHTRDQFDDDARIDESPLDQEQTQQWTDEQWTVVGPVRVTSRGAVNKSYAWHTEEDQLQRWSRSLNEKLLALAKILPNFKNLNELSFEASSESEGSQGPRWDYLFGLTMEKLIQALPTNLKSLTLDICGSTARQSSHDRTPVHLCPLLASRLQDFEHVRLRMRHICPRIYDIPKLPSDHPSKLSSLVIRLTLPSFPAATYERHDGYHEYDTQRCPSAEASQQLLPSSMIGTGRHFAKTMELDFMRITYRTTRGSGVDLYVYDCVRETKLYEPGGLLCYEDEGRAWDAWEDVDKNLIPLPYDYI